MTLPPKTFVDQTPPGLRRLIDVLRLQAECFGPEHPKILGQHNAIRLPKPEDKSRGDKPQPERR